MHGKQPLKFYSEHLTITKLSLIEHSLNKSYKNNKSIKLEQKIENWEKLLNY